MKKTKLWVLLVIVLLLAGYTRAQKLLVHVKDEQNTAKDSTYQVELGDVIAVAYQKTGSEKIHYFQGKVTGIFKDRGVVRIFDYGRSSRVVAIVGKKIRIDEIVAVKQLDKAEFVKREKGAVAMAIASSVGAGIGGRTGAGIQLGGAAGKIGNDLISREQVSKQKITIEFKD